MVVGPDDAWQVKPEDLPTVDALLRAAFPGPVEAELVKRLRADGDMVWDVTNCVACAALSRMVAPEGWLCLAPVAVWPDRQGQGIGSRLVSQIVEAVRMGIPHSAVPEPTLVVLGSPSFYARAGFSLERAVRLISSYPISHRLIARAGAGVPERKLVYPRAFDHL